MKCFLAFDIESEADKAIHQETSKISTFAFFERLLKRNPMPPTLFDITPPQSNRSCIKVSFQLLLCVLLIGISRIISTAQTLTSIDPQIVQPENSFTITFDRSVKIKIVMIGETATHQLGADSGDKFEILVPARMSVGRQTLSVSLEGVAEPVKSVITVAPLVLGLRSNKDAPLQLSRVVVPGGQVIVQFSEKIPIDLRQLLEVRLVDDSAFQASEEISKDPKKLEEFRKTMTDPQKLEEFTKKNSRDVCQFTVPEDDYLILTLPPCSLSDSELKSTTYSVQIRLDGVLLQEQPKVRVQGTLSMYWRASLVVLILILLIYLLYWTYKRINKQSRPMFLKVLLLEEENQTYSLSRAQFLAWLFVIIWSYLFLYYAHGFIDEKWSYPNLGNAIYAFLISLGTLVAAQATNIGVGVKGAGEEHPSPADLVLHGGVLALDRVQQVVWTLIALGMFIRITVNSYATATALPDIPPELLALMGLSSAGYLGGKLVRGAGPVIDQVTAKEGSVILSIKGSHLSNDAFVWIDGIQLLKDKVKPTLQDPDDPTKFAKELEVTLDISMADWNDGHHAITVINGDGQRAEWRTSAEIIEVTPSQPANGKVTLTIKGVRISPGATVQVNDPQRTQAKQDKTDPNLFTLEVDESWLASDHVFLLTNNGKQSAFPFKKVDANAGGGGGANAGGGADAGAANGGSDDSGGTDEDAGSADGEESGEDDSKP